MDSPYKKDALNLVFGEATFIAIATILGYAATAAFEYGYNSYFNIPVEYLSLTLTNILIGIGSSITSLLLLFHILNFFSILTSQKEKTALRRTVNLLLIFCGLAIIYWIVIFPPSMTEFLIPFCILIGLSLIEFCLPLITQREKPTYAEKIEAQWQTDREVGSKGLLAKIPNGYTWLIDMFFVCVLILFISYSSGISKAKNKSEFSVLGSNSRMIVLTTFDKYLLVSPLDVGKHKLENKLFLYNFDKFSDNDFLISSSTGKISSSGNL